MNHSMSEDERLDEILGDLIYDTPNHYGYPPDFEPDFNKAKKAIKALYTPSKSEATRFDLVDHRENGSGRIQYNNVNVELSYQDEGKTLKVFLTTLKEQSSKGGENG